MAMMNRRGFLYTAAAGAALVTRVPNAVAQSATYDLIIRGGRVIDPSLRIDGIRDVAIAQGRIAGRGGQHRRRCRGHDRCAR